MSMFGSIFNSKTERAFWKTQTQFNRWPSAKLKDGEKLYKAQCDALASALLIKDRNPSLTVDIHKIGWTSHFDWINKGELIAGSFMASEIAKSVNGKGFLAGDIDIYFKSRVDAVSFCAINSMHNADFSTVDPNSVCIYFNQDGMKFNLIWGIHYESPEHLVSGFDIRACSMAYDPASGNLYTVNGAIDDATEQRIILNPVPRATSINRIIKYTQKGFLMDKYQRVFFAELVRSEIYSSELELKTGYEVKSPIY